MNIDRVSRRWLPPAQNDPPAPLDHFRFLALCALPWFVLFSLITALGVPAHGLDFRLPFERRLPVLESTEAIYASTYLAVPLASFLASSRRDVRLLMIRAWLAMAVAFPMYVMVPVLAPRPVFSPATKLGEFLKWERGTYPPVAAFPSFHVIWAVLVAEAVGSRGSTARRVARLWAAAVAVSCVTTGMHSIADVAAGYIAAGIILILPKIWSRIRRRQSCSISS